MGDCIGAVQNDIYLYKPCGLSSLTCVLTIYSGLLVKILATHLRRRNIYNAQNMIPQQLP